MAQRPATTLASVRSPIVDSAGMSSWTFTKQMQEWATAIAGLPRVTFSDGVPLAKGFDGDLCFDTTAVPLWNGYVYRGDGWHRFS